MKPHILYGRPATPASKRKPPKKPRVVEPEEPLQHVDPVDAMEAPLTEAEEWTRALLDFEDRMSPLLFAVVDMVLAASMREAREHYVAIRNTSRPAEQKGNARWYWLGLQQHLGWWRVLFRNGEPVAMCKAGKWRAL